MVTHQIYARSCPNLLSWDDFSTAVRTVQGESLALILVSLKTNFILLNSLAYTSNLIQKRLSVWLLRWLVAIFNSELFRI